MNAQQIFDTVVAHLRKQGHPAKDENGMCVYRAPNGDMCAVGCLLPDEMYDEGMESLPVSDLLREGVPLPGYFPENEVLLRDLQEVHDDYLETDLFEDSLQRVAIRYGLNYAEPN